MTTYTATYSPDENKLRLYASSRLDSETYARVKAAGFKWAPKQDLFVAPMWTPGREDLLLELAGEIDDEDTSLVDRAEERADRFEDYSEKRLADAERAKDAVAAIADNIPFGQPILVGHHSEKHARRDAARIDSGMRKAVKMWETSGYWKARAEGAIRHAKYKELPAVRHRRIKTLEADKRKVERAIAESATKLKMWSVDGLTLEQARKIANYANPGVCKQEEGRFGYWNAYDVLQPDGERYSACPSMTVEQVQEAAKRAYSAGTENRDRWIAHYDNRLEYEKAMLADQLGADHAAGGDAMAGRFDFKVGGKVEVKSGAWLTIVRVNKAGGVVNSVTTTAPSHVTWCTTWKYGVEEIRDYQAPTEEQAAKVKAATALPPLCNYPGEGFREMTEAEWKAAMARKWSDFPYVGRVAATAIAGAHRVRQMPTPGSMWKKQQVFITDGKRVDPPKPAPKPEEKAEPVEEVESEGQDRESYSDDQDRESYSVESEPVPVLAIPRAEQVQPVTAVESQETADMGIPMTGPPVTASVLVESQAPPCPPTPANDPYQMMRDTLRAGGVKVTVAAQLFPTPRALAARVIEEARLKPGDRILEPEAGTGRLIDAAIASDWQGGELVAVENNPALASALLAKYGGAVKVRHADFLECNGELGTFDRIVMNPPFADQADVRHVLHAARFLRPGGRLVALMAAGVTFRQDRMSTEFREFVESRLGTIEPLPPDSFKESGTSVNAVLVCFDGE